jgi:lysyl endopeptidase
MHLNQLSKIALATLLAISGTAFGAMKTTSFPATDILKAHSEDVASEKLGNAPRFAIVHKVSLNPLNTNELTLENNNWIWRHQVTATNAVSLNFAFQSFKMSENSRVNIYSSDLSKNIRSFSATDNNAQNELWTPVLMTEAAIIELVIPKNEIQDVQFELSRINQGYRKFSETTEKSGSCNVDVVCTEGDNWRDEINSVAVISTGGSTFCTGFMVNNTLNDKTPFFMTAKHCRISSSNAASLVTYWNYQKSSCAGRANGKLNQFTTGSTFLAGSTKSDFTLVKLNSQPDAAYNVRYAGWDRSGEDAVKAIAIHHPATDEKSISFENDPTTVTTYLREAIPGDGTHVRVTDWDQGTTEPGSSGSPLFDQNHRVIGQLHGGYASCSSQTSDWYGRIFTSWEGEGTDSTSLKNHLDSAQTGDKFVDTL